MKEHVPLCNQVIVLIVIYNITILISFTPLLVRAQAAAGSVRAAQEEGLNQNTTATESANIGANEKSGAVSATEKKDPCKPPVSKADEEKCKKGEVPCGQYHWVESGKQSSCFKDPKLTKEKCFVPGGGKVCSLDDLDKLDCSVKKCFGAHTTDLQVQESRYSNNGYESKPVQGSSAIGDAFGNAGELSKQSESAQVAREDAWWAQTRERLAATEPTQKQIQDYINTGSSDYKPPVPVYNSLTEASRLGAFDANLSTNYTDFSGKSIFEPSPAPPIYDTNMVRSMDYSTFGNGSTFSDGGIPPSISPMYAPVNTEAKFDTGALDTNKSTVPGLIVTGNQVPVGEELAQQLNENASKSPLSQLFPNSSFAPQLSDNLGLGYGDYASMGRDVYGDPILLTGDQSNPAKDIAIIASLSDFAASSHFDLSGDLDRMSSGKSLIGPGATFSGGLGIVDTGTINSVMSGQTSVGSVVDELTQSTVEMGTKVATSVYSAFSNVLSYTQQVLLSLQQQLAQ